LSCSTAARESAASRWVPTRPTTRPPSSKTCANAVTPHIAINGAVSKHGVVRKTAVDGRTTRHAGYGVSQILRKRIEEVFGWIKAQAGFDQVKVRGLAKAAAVFTFAVAAYNLIRIPKLLAQASA
jgi:hypothetical protein